MPINPIGSFITIASSTLYVSDVKVSFGVEYFDRQEFMHERLRSAPNAPGQRALRTTLLGNTPAQIVIGTISFQDPVPLGPDVKVSGSNYGNIKKKFNIVRFEIAGAPSDYNAVSQVLDISANHIQQLAKFQAYLDKSGSMETEYAELVALQSETFSYLTTTGITMSGNALAGSVSNVLITNFNTEVAYEIPTDLMGGYTLLQNWSATIELRTISTKETVV